jgi:hypothetical protein
VGKTIRGKEKREVGKVKIAEGKRNSGSKIEEGEAEKEKTKEGKN